MKLFKKRKTQEPIKPQRPKYRPEVEAMIAELELTFWYKPNANTTKKYSLFNGDLKETYTKSYAQFDDEKELFSLQLSEDNENWVNTAPYVTLNNGKVFGILDEAGKSLAKFPMTLRNIMMLANIYACKETEKYNYWRVGINQDWGFIQCFSGKLNTPVFDTQGEMSSSVTCHLE